jgi:molecular chaperone GrpE
MENKKEENKNVEEVKNETPTNNEEINKLKALVSDLENKLKYQQAELINYRKRKDDETANLLKYCNQDLILELIPIVDNFERAISMDDVNLQDEVSKFLEGFKMIYGNLSSTLQGFEVLAMDILNKPFDPELMDAVLVEEVDGVEPNIVVDVLQKGYTYKGKVIRHAMVKVSK